MLSIPLILVLVFVVTFLLGSIPWGVIISRVFFKKDLRQEGSGNIGTTNAMRSIGKKGGIAVFLLDFGKGVLSGVLGMLVASAVSESSTVDDSWLSATIMAIAFIGCIWGHIFSPWLRFKGGKGIAVGIGCLIFVFGPYALIPLGAFIVLVLVTKYVSAGSIAAAVAVIPVAFWLYWGDGLAFWIISVAALTVIWAHRANINRLMKGKESRIGGKK